MVKEIYVPLGHEFVADNANEVLDIRFKRGTLFFEKIDGVQYHIDGTPVVFEERTYFHPRIKKEYYVYDRKEPVRINYRIDPDYTGEPIEIANMREEGYLYHLNNLMFTNSVRLGVYLKEDPESTEYVKTQFGWSDFATITAIGDYGNDFVLDHVGARIRGRIARGFYFEPKEGYRVNMDKSFNRNYDRDNGYPNPLKKHGDEGARLDLIMTDERLSTVEEIKVYIEKYVDDDGEVVIQDKYIGVKSPLIRYDGFSIYEQEGYDYIYDGGDFGERSVPKSLEGFEIGDVLPEGPRYYLEQDTKVYIKIRKKESDFYNYILDYPDAKWTVDTALKLAEVHPPDKFMNRVTVFNSKNVRYYDLETGKVLIPGKHNLDNFAGGYLHIEARPSNGYKIPPETPIWTFYSGGASRESYAINYRIDLHRERGAIEKNIANPLKYFDLWVDGIKVRNERQLFHSPTGDDRLVRMDVEIELKEPENWQKKPGVSFDFRAPNHNHLFQVRGTSRFKGQVIWWKGHGAFLYGALEELTPIYDATAIRPHLVDNKLKIPEVKGVQYYDAKTGFSLVGEVELVGEVVVKVRPTPGERYKILNGDIEWTFGEPPKKLYFGGRAYESRGYHFDYKELGSNVFDYVDFFVDGIKLDRHIYIVEGNRKNFEIVIKDKSAWRWGKNTKIQFSNKNEEDTKYFILNDQGNMEWSGPWNKKFYEGLLHADIRSTKEMIGTTLETTVHAALGKREITHHFPKDDFADIVEVSVNGELITKTNTEIEPGSTTISIKLKDEEVFEWDEAHPVREISIFLGQYNAKPIIGYFKRQADGTMFWEGHIPGVEQVSLLVLLYSKKEVVRRKFRTPDPIRANPKSNRIIFHESWPGEYFNIDTGEIYRDYTVIDKFTRIGVRTNPRYSFENDIITWYELLNSHIEYRFEYLKAEEKSVFADRPTRRKNIVSIPKNEDVIYYDILESEEVSGDVDLLTRGTQRLHVRVFAKYPGVKIENTGAEWEFWLNENVHSVKPNFQNNRVIIPVIEGVDYYDEAKDQLLGGTFTITEDITITAVAKDTYTLISEVNKWTFTFKEIEKVEVLAEKPTQDRNWVFIPRVEGVLYFNKHTNEELTGTIYLDKDISIKTQSTGEQYIHKNPDVEWTFLKEETKEKEIIITNRSSLLVVYVNGLIDPDDVLLVEPEEQVEITLVLGRDTNFTEAPYIINASGDKVNFELSNDKTAANLVHTFEDNEPVELHASRITSISRLLRFIGDNTTLLVEDSSGRVFTVEPGSTERLEPRQSYNFEVRANEGYQFDKRGIVRHAGLTEEIEIVRGSSYTRAKASVTAIHDDVTVEMSAVRLEPDVPTETTGFNNLYVVDKVKLSDISLDLLRRRRDFIITGTDGGGGGLGFDPHVLTDPHTYIINTLQLPFTIPPKDLANRQSIILGFTKLLPSAVKLKNDLISLDLGKIEVEPKYNNSYDYANTSTIVHLPYLPPTVIDANYVMEQTISIEYLVDAYTGEATVNLRSTLTEDKVFYSTKTKVGNTIPFITMKDATTIGSPKESESIRHNNTPTPFIEVIRNTPHQMDSMFNRDVQTTVDSLNELTGTVYVHDIDIQVDTTLDELSTIKSVLSAGVVIQ